MISLTAASGLVSAHAAENLDDAFDRVRRSWLASLVGDERFDPSAPGVRERIDAQAGEAQALWKDMVKAPCEDLWPRLQTATDSAGVTSTGTKLGVMVRAYSTRGSALYHDPALRADVLMALRWFVTVRYHAGVTPHGNWWDWHIGVPLALLPCLALLCDDLPAETMRAGTDAIEGFNPVISSMGANGAWRAEIVLRRAVLVRDVAKMAAVQDWMNEMMLQNCEPPDDPAAAPHGFTEGFYGDGSFFAHGRHPYTGGYGVSALASAVGLVALVAGTPWDVAESNRARVCEWIANSFEPILFRGNLFDNMRGREISRGSGTGFRPPTSPSLLDSLLTAATTASEPDSLRVRSYIKGLAPRGTTIGLLPAPQIARLQALLADPTVPAAAPAVLFRHFPLMARTVLLRENFGAAVSMYSDSVYNYESINHENLRGWHTGDGWLQILDADLTQYTDGYWPTVDWHRLPGTTAVRGSTKPSNRVNGSPWAGGADLDGVNGITGFELRPVSGQIGEAATQGMIPAADDQTLTARKSWFMLGDEIFCVGSGIAASDTEPVETILENRRLDGEGNNVLTVDGRTVAPQADQQTMTARWWHLAGNVPGSSLGCVFAEPARVQMLREFRTETWQAINTQMGDDTPVRRRFMTLWLDHGIQPAHASYAYVLLPGRSAEAVAQYSAAPSTVLLAATGAVHAVTQRDLGVTAANFWEDADASLALDGARRVTVDKRACVLYRHRAGVTELAVSDPTRANRASIRLVFNIPLGRVLEAGKFLRADTSPSGTVITLDLDGAESGERGHTFRIKLAD